MPGLQKVLNMPEYAWIIPEYIWLRLHMPEYIWICLKISKYTWICLNQLDLLLLYFPIFPLVTYFNVYTKIEVTIWRKMKLFDFFQAENSWFVFRFRANIFAGKIWNLLLILRCEATEGWGPWTMLW